jgi:hypothetical protein
MENVMHKVEQLFLVAALTGFMVLVGATGALFYISV